MAMAPIYEAAPRCPAMVRSISPSRGTVILERMDGRAMCSISLWYDLFMTVICWLNKNKGTVNSLKACFTVPFLMVGVAGFEPTTPCSQNVPNTLYFV